MPTFLKETLAPNRVYHTPQGKIRLSEADVRGIYERSKAMIKAGLPVPLPANHQKSAKPGSPKADRAKLLADKTLHNTGWVKDYVMKDGRLFTEMEVLNPQAAAGVQLGTIKFVSPEIENFIDGDGKDWGSVITHVALTPRPVWHAQKPFDHEETKKTQPFAKLGFTTLRLSLDSSEAIQMALPEETEEKPEAKVPAEEAPSEKPAEETDKEPIDEAGGGKSGRLHRIKVMLAELCDIGLPESTTAEQLLEHLEVALHTKQAVDNNADEDEDLDPMDPNGLQEEMPNMAGQGGGYTMSLDKLTAKVSTLQEQNAALQAKHFADEKAKRTRRINRLLLKKHMSPGQANALKATVDGFQLSFDREMNVAIPSVDAILDHLEKETKGRKTGLIMAGTGAQLGLDEHEPDDDNSAPVSKEKARQIAEEQLKSIGR